MENKQLTIEPVESKSDLKKFIKVPWQIYENDPAWVPPLLLDKKLDIYTAFEMREKKWARADRNDEDDRLYYNDKSLSLGVKYLATDNFFIDISGGHASGRRFYEGENFENDRTDGF